MGPQLKFETDGVIAVTGGDLSPTLDGQPVPAYAALAVKARATLRFRAPKAGCRTYIALPAGGHSPCNGQPLTL